MKTPPLILYSQPQHVENSRKAMAKRAKAIREEKSNRSRKSNKCEECGKYKKLFRRSVCRFCYNDRARLNGAQGYGKKPKKVSDPHSIGTILLMGEYTHCPYPGCQWQDERRNLRLHIKNCH